LILAHSPTVQTEQVEVAYSIPADGLVDRVNLSPDDSERCLASLLRALSSELAADGLLVSWHSASQGQSLALFASGACSGTWPDRAGVVAFAANLADNSLGSLEPVTAGGSCAHGRLWSLVVPLVDGAVSVTSVFHRGNLAEPSARPLLQRALPMLQPFFRLWAASRKASARFAGLVAAIDHCDVATLIVSREGEVLFANKAGEQLLASRNGIDRKGGRLGGATLPDTLRLQAAIDHVLSSAKDGQSDPVVALRRSKGRPLMVSLARAALPDASFGQAVAIAYIFDPDRDLTRLIQPACTFYGLSTSETRLTCKLVSGATVAEAAKAVGVREQTARSCLKQIFLKTETNRQAELVWLMLKSAVHVTGAGRTQMF